MDFLHDSQDHIGTAGFVYDYFAQDNPTIIASKRTRADLKTKDNRDSSSVFGAGFRSVLQFNTNVAVEFASLHFLVVELS